MPGWGTATAPFYPGADGVARGLAHPCHFSPDDSPRRDRSGTAGAVELRWSSGRAAPAARLAGRLDDAASAPIEELTTMARLLPYPVEVDLSAVTVADERGIAVLRDAIGRSDGRVRYVNGPPELST